MRIEQSNDTVNRFFASSIGALIAEILTLPSDVAKTRLQVQRDGASLRYKGLFDCVVRVAREEGMGSLWKGLGPALVRQVSYTSLSLVLYEPLLHSMGSSPGFSERLAAGGIAGALSISVFNWTEVLKTKLQNDSGRTGLISVTRTIFKRDGIKGFWAGYKPNVCRTFLVNAAELGTYDQCKTILQEYTGEGLPTHMGASFIAGLASAMVSTPADVIKTRMMDQAGSGGMARYRGIGHALKSIWETEGGFAFYKGFVPILLRKVMWTTIFFVTYEKWRDTTFI